MPIASEDLTALTVEIWTATLGLDLVPVESAEAITGEIVTSCVQITGDWSGAITMSCPIALANQVAQIMFEMEVEDLGDDEVNDAMGEMANMAAGNLKAIIGSGQLSLPTVTRGTDYQVAVPSTVVIEHGAFSSEGSPLNVTVHERVEK